MNLSKLSIIRTSLFPRRYLIFDDRYHKIGCIEFRRGVWYCIDNQSKQEFMGFTRGEAFSNWFYRL